MPCQGKKKYQCFLLRHAAYRLILDGCPSFSLCLKEVTQDHAGLPLQSLFDVFESKVTDISIKSWH